MGPANSDVTDAIRKTNEALTAAGVPGVNANTGLGPAAPADAEDPCGNPVPWTGLLCTEDRVTQV